MHKAKRIDESFSPVVVIRSLDALLHQEEVDSALDYVSEAIRLDSGNSVALAVQSQILSSASDSTHRDGDLALRSAKRACELTDWNQWPYLRTLAAAHAENGDYEYAVRTIERAIKLAPPLYQEELRHALELFQQRKPFRLGPDPEELFYPFFESADH